MLEKIKVGDIVELKSGGPPMTVHSAPANGKIICYFFDSGELKKEEINKLALKKIK